MAKRKRKSTRRRGAARRNPARALVLANAPRKRRRGSARRNPPAMLRNLVPFATDAAIGAVRTTAGKIVTRKVRGLTKQQAGSPIGMAVEGVIAVLGGALLSTVHRGAGRDFAVGGLQAPLETTVQRLNIPHVSDSLADDGFYLGEDYGVGAEPEYVGGGGYTAGRLAGEDPTYGLGASSTGERYAAGLSAA